MPVPTHMRFVFRGVYEGTPEEWSFSAKFSRDAPAEEDAHVGDIDQGAVTTALTTFFNASDSLVPDYAMATDWRAYEIGTDGRMENNPLLVDVSALNIDGVQTTKLPPQCAAVVTTVGANRGLARFGRFYLPTAANVGTDLRLTAAQALALANRASTFLKDVSNAIDMPLALSSEGLNISAAGAGARQAIDHLEVGRVIDTLRSRRRSLDEDRQSTGHIDW